jgi:predicted metalloprotease with PDZ domain
MRLIIKISLLCLIVSGVRAQTIQYKVDLQHVSNDRVRVQVTLPKQSTNSIVFSFPKQVPGTYANYDFGRYIQGFKALDKSGNALPVQQKNSNQYQITQAQSLDHLEYEVNDTWDSPEIKGEYIFEPAGTNIQKDTLIAFNVHGFLGFVEGLAKNPVQVSIQKPSKLYGSTSLQNVGKDNLDVFTSPNYQSLVDAPILYSEADTASIQFPESNILISVYSPNKTINATEIAENIRPLLIAQRNYLGGKLPVKKYAFLIVLSSELKGGSFGALEHTQSSFYYLPEGGIEQLGQTIRDVCAHEFFHIVTPLSIHSEEIGNFNFMNPQMSEHLWLYEGLTEYAAHHMQLKGKLINDLEFFKTIQEKKETMELQFDSKVPFTTMSKQVLGKYKEQYGNVYQKGALIGFGLDITLRRLSQGKWNNQLLLQALSKEFGPMKSFKDEQLFDKIIQITHLPSLREFFQDYVAGAKALPMQTWLNQIGYTWDENQQEEAKTLGFDIQGLTINETTKRATLQSSSAINALGQQMGMREKDELIAINGLHTDLENFVKNTQKILQIIQPGDTLAWDVARKKEDGSYQTYHLKAPYFTVQQASRQAIRALKNPSKEQWELRNNWMK